MTRARALAAAAIVGVLLAGWLASSGALWYRTADYHCLREGARLLLVGLDPYDPGAWRPLIEQRYADPFRGIAPSSCVARYASPLWTAAVMLPFGLLPYEISAWLWMALSIGAVLLGMRGLWRGIGGSARAAPLFAVIVVASQPFWLLLVGGQVTGLLLGLVGAAMALDARGRPGAAGAALGALVIKPQVAAFFVPAMVLRDALRGRPRTLVGAAAAMGVLGIVSVALRPGWIPEWLDEVGGRRLGYAGLLPSSWGLASDVLGSSAWAPVLIVVALVSVGVAAGRRPLDRPTFAAIALALSLFAAPHVWSYDMLVLALPWAVAVALADRMSGPRRPLMLMAAVMAATVLPWWLFAAGIERGQETWSAVIPVAAAIVVALAHRLSNVRIISEPSTWSVRT